MTDELMLVFGDDGIAREYKDDFDITIHCETKEEQEKVWKRLAQDDWTPCSRDLPEEEGSYLVTDDAGGMKTVQDDVFFHYEDGTSSWMYSQNVIAWMPLPEPYRGEQDDTD